MNLWISSQHHNEEPLNTPSPPDSSSLQQNRSHPPTSLVATLTNRTPTSNNTDPRITRYTNGTVDYNPALKSSRQLHQTNSPPQADLEILSKLLTDYRLFFESNPVGSENAEITAALLGQNPKQLIFLDPTLTAISPTGELLDRWGTPYIFHPLTSTEMDIRSLGPDRTLWTDDDLNLDLSATEESLQLTR
ncbi:MAG: hypothetical protein AAGC74_05285 [Verrucomicrobiota bacterium]